MAKLIQAVVEAEIKSAVEEINNNLKIGAKIDSECRPGEIGISSQILLTIMSRLEDSLGVIIPSNVYLFHDKEKQQLSIQDAAKKLIKFAKQD